jgi:hypothetical protein
MKLQKSNYDNKAVINHLKSSLSIIESAGENTTFTDTQSFIDCNVSVSYKDNTYNVSLTKDFTDYNTVVWGGETTTKSFDTRTEAIKHILKALKIIK